MKISKKYLVFTIIICVLAVAINAYIIMHSCLDAAESSKASAGVVEVSEEVVNTVAPGTVTPENHDSFATFIRKAFGHFGLFVISGLFTSLSAYLTISPTKWSKHYLNVIIGLSVGLIIASITEIIQLSVPGRSGETRDVLIDFSGYLLGTLIIGFILFFYFKNKRKNETVTQ